MDRWPVALAYFTWVALAAEITGCRKATGEQMDVVTRLRHKRGLNRMGRGAGLQGTTVRARHIRIDWTWGMRESQVRDHSRDLGLGT